MLSVRAFLRKVCGLKARHSTKKPPSLAWLLEHRAERSEQPALTEGPGPLASLYRMYEYLVVGYTIGLRSEIEFFFNQPSWAVKDIPDPKDPDPARYTILAVLPQYLTVAFNHLIERGLPRGSPAIIVGSETENALRAKPVVLEEIPPWSTEVPALDERLVIPNYLGDEPTEDIRSPRFLQLNIITDEPHVLFM